MNVTNYPFKKSHTRKLYNFVSLVCRIYRNYTKKIKTCSSLQMTESQTARYCNRTCSKNTDFRLWKIANIERKANFKASEVSFYILTWQSKLSNHASSLVLNRIAIIMDMTRFLRKEMQYLSFCKMSWWQWDFHPSLWCLSMAIIINGPPFWMGLLSVNLST